MVLCTAAIVALRTFIVTGPIVAELVPAHVLERLNFHHWPPGLCLAIGTSAITRAQYTAAVAQAELAR